jgi:hypothetical protein
MDELVELERVDLAGVVTLEALTHVLEQPPELGLVIGADGGARGSPLRLRRTGTPAHPAAGIADCHRLRNATPAIRRACGHDAADPSVGIPARPRACTARAAPPADHPSPVPDGTVLRS